MHRIQNFALSGGSFSDKTKENIFEYFLYLRNIVKIHDCDNYDDWNYWLNVFRDFIHTFDEENPYYDGNFENGVLRNGYYRKRI